MEHNLNIHCLGCGCKTSQGDRRVLCSEASRSVLPIWEQILDEKMLEIGKEVDKQALVGEKGSKSAGSICRACFRSFERYRKLQAGLLDNMEKAIAAIGIPSESTIGQKRPRASDCERC